MAYYKGQNLRLLIGGKCIAAATTCSLHIAANLEETSTKDSTNDWQEQECVSKSWDLSAEALVPNAEDTAALEAFDAATLVGTTVEVAFDITNGDKNRTTVKTLWTGNAIINDFSLSAQNKTNVQASFQAQGTGELKKATA